MHYESVMAESLKRLYLMFRVLEGFSKFDGVIPK